MRSTNVFITILLLCASAFSQQQQYDVSVSYVTVWVKVTDSSGNAVEGLAQSDFEVFENNKRMQLTCFEETKEEEESSRQTAQNETATPATTKRNEEPWSGKRVVLFLELTNTSEREYIEIKPHLFSFLKDAFARNWDIMAAVSAGSRVSVLFPFSTDEEWMKESLNKLKANPSRDQAVSMRKRQISQIFNSTMPADEKIRSARAFARQYARQEKQETLASLESLKAVGNYLAAEDSSEHLVFVYVSGGFISEPGRAYYLMIDQFIGDTQAAGFSSENNPESNFDLLEQIRKNVGSMTRKNMTLYAINTRGVVNPSTSDTIYESSRTVAVHDPAALSVLQEGMEQMAAETGGLTFKNSTDFEKGFKEIIGDLSHQYVLCYKAPEQSKKGEYQKIKVKVNREKLKLRYRSGYLS